MRFEWDPEKARRNLAKHGVSLEEAATAFADPLSITRFDPDHSDDDDRFLLLGATHAGHLALRRPHAAERPYRWADGRDSYSSWTSQVV